MRTFTIAAILTIAALLGLVPAMAAEAPQTPPEPLRRPVASTTTTTQPKPSKAVLQRSEGESCPGWIDLAREVGWPEEELPMVAAVVYFESRCQADIKGDKAKSFGLMQIHTSSWCKPNKYWPDGYLQAKGLLKTCDELLDPATNLRVGLEIWQVGTWKQWSTWKLASTTLDQ